MEIQQKLGRYRLLILVMTVLFALNILAAWVENAFLFKISRLIAIPVLLSMYFGNMRYMANVFFLTFVVFFLGDVFLVFDFGVFATQLSMVFYTLSYLLLLFVLIGKFKRIKFEGLVSLYLVLIFLINSYFLYVLYEIVQDNLTDRTNFILIVSRSISLISMSFLAFAVYLSSESKQSIIFLSMSFCFVFSDILYYVNNLYVYYWLFELLDKILHVVGIALFFIYVTNHHRISKSVKKLKPSMKNASDGAFIQ